MKQHGDQPLLSVVIPAYNEEGCLESTVVALGAELDDAGIPYEIVIVDDHSRDATLIVANKLATGPRSVRVVSNTQERGFGSTVRCGLSHATGDFIAIVMADGCDSPADLLSYYEAALSGSECVFGSRFQSGGSVKGYPLWKLVCNRLGNWGIRMLFRTGYDDTTNAFKLYSRRAVEQAFPLTSTDFALTIELPMKVILSGFSFATLPVQWVDRKTGESKFRIRSLWRSYLRVVWELRAWAPPVVIAIDREGAQ